MKRIAYLCADPGIPVFGCKGASVHVQEVIRALRRTGSEVHLYAARPGGEAPGDLADLPVHATPAPVPGAGAPGAGAPGAGAAAAAAPAEARARAALRANRAVIDALAADGPFDLVYERYSLWSSAGVAYASGAGGCPSLVEVNAPLIDEQAAWRGLPLPRYARRLARYLFRHADGLLPVSPGVARWIAGFQVPRERIHVIPNGVDPSRFDAAYAARQRPRTTGALTIGFVGTLKPWHGVPTLVDGWARLRERGVDAALLLVGDGPERARIEADLRARGLAAHATLTGSVVPADVPALLARMDIAVAPYPATHDFYFSPLKLYEYLAAGLPVACSRVGHLGEVIRDGIDGLLFEAGSPAALADALLRLAADAPLRARLGRAGRARVLADHTWDGVARRILSLAALASTEGAAGARGRTREVRR